MTVKSAGLAYFEHWRNDMQDRYAEYRQRGNADDLDQFRDWHEMNYGHGTTFGSWMEHEADKLRSDT